MTSSNVPIPRIVLYREGINGEELAASTVGGQNVLDAFTFMQGDEEAELDAALVSTEGGFFAANLTDSQAQELSGRGEVEEVIDDEEVFALDVMGDDSLEEDLAMGELELDPEEAAEIDDITYLGVDAAEDPAGAIEEARLLSEEARLLTEIDPPVTEADIQFENQLLDATADASVDQLSQPLGIPRTQLKQLISSVIKYVLEQRGSVEDVSEADIESVLSASGMEAGAAAHARDVILWNLWLIYAPYAWRTIWLGGPHR